MSRPQRKQTADVIYLPGCKPGRADRAVVAELKRMLIQAERGEIAGLAFIAVKRDVHRYGLIHIPDFEEALEAVDQLRGALMAHASL